MSLAPTPPPEPAGPVASASPRKSSWLPRVFWLVAVGVAAGGWFSREQWWPALRARAEPLLARYVSSGAPKGTKAGSRTVPVLVEAAARKDVDFYLNALGTVVPFRTVTLRSRVEGELIRINFTEGQLVKEGDLLAEIDPRGWHAQLEQMEGQRDRNEAALRAAQKTLVRYRQLLTSKQITPQELDDQLGLVEQAQASVKTDEAMVANAELQLSYCRITAPVTGRIGLRLVDQGNIVRPTDASGIAVITQLKPISVTFTIPQDDIARVRKRLDESREDDVLVFGRDFKDQLAKGRLVAVDNQVDSATGTLRLKAEFKNEDEILFPNQFVNVRLHVETVRNALVVPTAALQRGPDGPFVYVVTGDDVVEPRPVSAGASEGLDTILLSGIEAGDAVVTRGLDQLRSGTKVSVKNRGKPPSSATARKSTAGVAEPKLTGPDEAPAHSEKTTRTTHVGG